MVTNNIAVHRMWIDFVMEAVWAGGGIVTRRAFSPAACAAWVLCATGIPSTHMESLACIAQVVN